MSASIVKIGSPVDPSRPTFGIPGKIQLYITAPPNLILNRGDLVQVRGTNFDGIYEIEQNTPAAPGNIISLNCDFSASYRAINGGATLVKASPQSVLSPCPGNVSIPINRVGKASGGEILVYFTAPVNPQDITEVINRNVSITGTNFDGVYNVVDANLESNIPGLSTLSLGCLYSSNFRIVSNASFRVTDSPTTYCPLPPSTGGSGGNTGGSTGGGGGGSTGGGGSSGGGGSTGGSSGKSKSPALWIIIIIVIVILAALAIFLAMRNK